MLTTVKTVVAVLVVLVGSVVCLVMLRGDVVVDGTRCGHVLGVGVRGPGDLGGEAPRTDDPAWVDECRSTARSEAAQAAVPGVLALAALLYLPWLHRDVIRSTRPTVVRGVPAD